MESKNLKEDRIDQVNRLLTEYTENKLLLSRIKIVDVRLDLNTNDLKSMTSEDLNDWRFEIAAYLTYLQKEINTHKSRANWAAGALKAYVDTKAINFQGYGMDEKRGKAMEHDTYAARLSKLALESEATLNRLEYLPKRIEAMADIARDIIWSRKERYNAEKNDE